MKNGLVSIIMPTYNCADFIEESILSVINQTYTNWELIIVDDCSKDNTEEVVKKYTDNDKRIRYIRLETNSGAAIARNTGIEMAIGEFIAFLDSDDLWLNVKLEKQLEFMNSHGYNFSCTAYMQIDEQGNENGTVVHPKKRVDYNGVLLSCPIGNSTVIYNCKNIGKFYVPNIRKRNDDALWLQILKKEKYCYGLDTVLMKYRIRQNSLSRNKLQLVKYHWYLYREIEHLSIPRSIFHIVVWGFLKVFKIK